VLYDNQHRIDEAILLIERALEGYERTRGNDDKMTIDAIDKLGTIYASSGRHRDAEAILKRAACGYEKLFGAEHDAVFRMKKNLANVYVLQDMLREAVVHIPRHSPRVP
jgi:tetratricopeptide (TPR) repeat protein